MNKVRIVSAITSAAGITLYTDEGRELNLPATGWRTKAIMDEITRPLARHRIAEIDLDDYSAEARVEQKSGGVIKFLRKKVRDFATFFKLTPQPESEPEPPKPAEFSHSVVDAGQLAQMADLSLESDVDTSAPTVDPNLETVVAVVNGVEIPGMEKLERHIEHAAFNNTKGLERFLERVAKTTSKREHTVQELLNFMQRGDLPIADDGSIVAYKVLRKTSDVGVFVDCHTQKVRQRVGSRVSMDEKLVDKSRRTECSTGLHVARRAYLRNFGADIATLIKVAPEDVVAVPHREPDKMRVAAYQIVALLPQDAYALLKANKPMTSNVEAAKLLANVIAGDHLTVLEEVVIGGAYGADVNTTLVQSVEPEVVAEVEKPEPPVDNGVAKALDDNDRDNAIVTVKAVRQAAEEEAQKRVDARERDNARRREKRAAAKASREPEKSQPAPQPEETASERRNRVKREKRAAAKAQAPAPAKVPELKKPANDNRDQQILDMLTAGRSQRSIAKELKISDKTIRKLIASKPFG